MPVSLDSSMPTRYKGRFSPVLVAFLVMIIIQTVMAMDSTSHTPLGEASPHMGGNAKVSALASKGKRDVLPGVSEDVFTMLNQEAVHKALLGLDAKMGFGEDFSLLEMASAMPAHSGARELYKQKPITTETAGDIGMQFIQDVIAKVKQTDILSNHKDVAIEEFLNNDFQSAPSLSSLSVLLNPASFFELGAKITESIQSTVPNHRKGSNDGRVTPRFSPSAPQSAQNTAPVPLQQKSRAASRPVAPRGPSLLQQSATTAAAAAASTSARMRDDDESKSYEAPTAPPSFTDWLNGAAPGAGETAENLGTEYKPDPRRHPPPPPVPSPPPPPPPPSFSSESPMASYSFMEQGSTKKVHKPSEPSIRAQGNVSTQGVTPIVAKLPSQSNPASINKQSVADRLRQVKAAQDKKRK